MKTYSRKNKAQSTIEFSMAFILAILFLFLSANLFVWFNRNIVQRQKAYEQTRIYAGSGPVQRVINPDGSSTDINCKDCEPGKPDFYDTTGPKKNPNYKPLNVFTPGGYNK